MINDENKKSYYFLGLVFVVYIAIFIFNYSFGLRATIDSWDILKQVFITLILVWALMVIIDYFINPKSLKVILGEKSGILGWVVAIITGIISTGPIYLWYPLLSDLKKDGMRDGYIATFLYNRAIKIPLIPMALVYFDLKYLIILGGTMVMASIFQGFIINMLLKGENK